MDDEGCEPSSFPRPSHRFPPTSRFDQQYNGLESYTNFKGRVVGKAAPFTQTLSPSRHHDATPVQPINHEQEYPRPARYLETTIPQRHINGRIDENSVISEIVRIICNVYFGCVLISKLKEALGDAKVIEYFGGSNPEIFFTRHHHIFQLERDGGDWKVTVRSKIKLCDDYRTKDGCRKPDCKEIHICKLFIMGTCRYGSPDTSSANMGAKVDGLCRLAHAFQCDRHNNEVLKDKHLDIFEGSVLKIIIRQSCPDAFKPDICKYYNTPGGCQKKDHCLSLHMCRDYITARCKYGQKCKFSHRVFDPQPKGVLQKYGVDTSKPPSEVLHMLKSGSFAVSSERRVSKPQEETGAVPRRPSFTPTPRYGPPSPHYGQVAVATIAPTPDEFEPGCRVPENQTIICMHHIEGRCNYGNRCVKHHFDTPYMWQKLKGPGDWVNYSEDRNENFERKFCDTRIDKFERVSRGMKAKIVDFNKMVVIDTKLGKVNQIRRCSTVTSVKGKPHDKMATEWLWYWEDEHSNWHLYGEQGTRGQKPAMQSTDIERAYATFIDKGTPNTFVFSAGGQTYTLYFTHMYQQNDHFKTRREVRRRPKFVSEDDLKKRKRYLYHGHHARAGGRITTGIPPIGTGSLPKHWDKSAKDLGGYRLVTLSESGDTADEYRDVVRKFQESMPHDLIVSVERVQNIELWKFLARRYEAMRKWRSDDGNKVDVRHLFHGTSDKRLDVICRQNFDSRLSGTTTGTAFGKGAYFASSAKYSDSYAQSSNLYRKIFLTRVLVGDFIQGRPDYVRPPPKDVNDPFGQLYDSCVNNMMNPTIYVIFESSQVYPEYVITYMRYHELDKLMQ
ncbi:protein mono-ADP-ribosyltransferase PARP12-like [Glandiceps talaboti]